MGQLSITVAADAGTSLPEYNSSGVSDANRSENTTAQSTLAPYPNLTATGVTGPASALLGQPITVSWTNVNQGNAVASGTWRDGIYLYASPTDSNPEFLGSAGFGGTLAAGQSAQLSATVSLRQEVAGPYYIAVVPDYLEQVIEAGNTRLAALSSQATQILTPDLAVELVQSSATSAEFGQQFNVTWTVENTGDGTAIGTWSDKLYLSPQPTLGSSATFLATQPEGLNSPLAAGPAIPARQR